MEEDEEDPRVYCGCGRDNEYNLCGIYGQPWTHKAGQLYHCPFPLCCGWKDCFPAFIEEEKTRWPDPKDEVASTRSQMGLINSSSAFLGGFSFLRIWFLSAQEPKTVLFFSFSCSFSSFLLIDLVFD